MFELTEYQFLRFAAECLPIGERYFERAELLSSLGFRRHEWHFNRAKDLCSKQEWQESRRILLEISKETAASYGPNPIPLHWHIAGYKSQLIESLRRERDRSGMNFEWFKSATRENWRYLLVPADQIMEKTLLDRSTFSENFRIQLRQHRAIASETEQTLLADRLILRDLVNVQEKISSWPNSEELANLRHASSKLLTYELLVLGLEFNKKLSTKVLNVFSCTVNNEMQLRLAVAIGRQEVFWHFFVCNTDLPKKPDGGLTELYLGNRHFEFRIVDATAGGSVFQNFASPGELEVSLRALVEILKSEFEYIRTKVVDVLG